MTEKDNSTQRSRWSVTLGRGPVMIVPMPVFIATSVVVGITSLVVLFLGARYLFARWAASMDPVAMASLTVWVWMYHIVQILKRQQPIVRGILRGVAFTSLTILLVIGGGALLAWAAPG